MQKNIWRKKNIAFPNANPMMMMTMMMMMLIIIITIIIIIIIIIISSSSSSSSSISFSLVYISAGCGSIKWVAYYRNFTEWIKLKKLFLTNAGQNAYPS